MNPSATSYFDFVSPYSALALFRAKEMAHEHGFTWRVRPVAYGPILSRTGLIGPAEVDEDHLVSHIQGQLDISREHLNAILNRPNSADRRRSRHPSESAP